MGTKDLVTILICHMVPREWGQEMPSTASMPEAGRRADPEVIKVWELLLSLTSSSTQESRPCTSPGLQNRTGPVGGCGRDSPEAVITGVLSLCLICHTVIWAGERCLPLLLIPHYLQWKREVTLPFTILCTQESGPCTSPGQHNRVVPVGGGMAELALRV